MNIAFIDSFRSDGMRAKALLAAMLLFVSTLTFIASSPTASADSGYSFKKIALSGSGQFIYAANNSGSIWKSSDTGTTWSSLTSAGTRGWQSIATSQDGSVVVAADNTSGNFFVSQDFGDTWIERSGFGSGNWRTVVISNDGSKIKAINGNLVKLYESDDFGATWRENSTLPTMLNTGSNPDGTGSSGGCTTPCAVPNWAELTMSGSGAKIALLARAAGSYESGRQLFISQDSGATWIQTMGCCRDQSSVRQIASSRSDTNWTIMMGNYASSPGYMRYDSNAGAWTRTSLRVREQSGDATTVGTTTWKGFAIAADGDQAIFTGAFAGWEPGHPGRYESLFTGAISSELVGVYHDESPGSYYDDVAISDSGAVRAALKSSTGEIVISIDSGVTYSRIQIFELPLSPSLNAATEYSNSYTVQVNNYDAAYSWTVSSTSGTASIDGNGLITVANPIGRSTLTVRTSKSGVADGVTTYTARDLDGNRKASATWAAVPGAGGGNLFNGTIYSIVENPINGDIVVGGTFTSLGSETSSAYIASFDGVNWRGLLGPNGGLQSGAGSGERGVYALAFDSLGNLYAGGNFANAGGVADADFLAKWDGTNWSSVGTSSLNGSLRTIKVVTDSEIYIGGHFTSAASITGADYIARWDGVNWSKVGNTPLTSIVLSIAHSRHGTLYISGQFNNAGGVSAADKVARLSGNDWTSVGASNPGFDLVRGLVVDDRTSTDILYAGASYYDGSRYQYLGRFDGTTWEPLDFTLTSNVRALFFDSRYGLFVSGWFDSDNRYARGFALYVDDKLYGVGDDSNAGSGTGPAHQYIQSILITRNGGIYVGGQGQPVASLPYTEYLARTASWSSPAISSAPSNQQNVSIDLEVERQRLAKIREEKIVNSRENIRQALMRGEVISASMMQAADYPQMSEINLEDLNTAMLALSSELRGDRKSITALIEKFALVEKLTKDNPNVISARTLIDRGIMSESVIRPTLTLKILKGVPMAERESFSLIQKAISQVQEKFAAQRAKLKLLLGR